MRAERRAAIDGAALLAVLRVINNWSTPSGALTVDADERGEFDAEILSALRGAASDA